MEILDVAAGRPRRRPGGHDRLKEQLEAILFRGPCDTCHPMHLAMAMRAAARFVDMNAIAPFIFRRITGDVGRAHDIRNAFGVRFDLHHTDACAHGQGARAPHETIVANRLADAFRDPGRLLERATFQQHSEFITAQPCDRVRGPDACLQQSRHIAQQPVAGLVPAGVVHDLELIQVDIEERGGSFAPLRAQNRGVQPIVELAPIDQPGEGVVAGLVGQRPLEAPLLGDIVEDDDRTDDTALAIADRRGRFLDGHFLPGARDEHRMIGRYAALAAAQGAHQGILNRLARDLVDEIEHVRERTSPGLIETPCGQRLGDRVYVLDPPFGIGADDRVADGLERHLCPLLFGEHGLLGALAFSDVRNRTLVPHNSIGSVLHSAGIFEDDELLPVPPAHEKLRIEDLPFRFHAAHEIGAVRGVPVQLDNVRQGVEFLS